MLVDGVFSGGGMKGLALVGAYQVLEEKGVRFQRVAGTSAGAIIASLIAAGYTGKEMEDILFHQDFQSFLDRRKTIIPFSFMKWLHLYWGLGLYQGNALEEWFHEILGNKGLYTFADLTPGTLKFVASDITNGKMIVLPDDLEGYGIPAEHFPIARALRMSCSIPFFFEPVRLRTFNGETIAVDGGVLSNFPMWLFDKPNQKKERPVIGMKLSQSIEEQQAHIIKNGLHLFEALFDTMKDAHDTKYISRKFEKDVIFIPVDKHLTTKFNIEDEQKEQLLEMGRFRARQFMFTWKSHE